MRSTDRLFILYVLLIALSISACGTKSNNKAEAKPSPITKKFVVPSEQTSKTKPNEARSSDPADLEKFGYPEQVADKLQILSLLRSENYDALEALMSSYQLSFNKDYRYENSLMNAYSAFEVADPNLERLFDEWIQKFPSSDAALAARAIHYKAMAWASRGADTIDKTSDEQIAGMDKYFEKAALDATKAIKQNPKVLSAYEVLISKAQTQGGAEESERILQMALKVCPYTFSLRAAHMRVLKPRWGGSFQEIEQFANSSQNYVSMNPKLKLLKGYVAYEMAEEAADFGEDYSKALRYYSEAVSYGDYWVFLTGRAECLVKLKDYSKALPDLDRSNQLSPQKVRTLKCRGATYYYLGQPDKAKADFQIASMLDPTNDYIQKWIGFLNGQM